MNRFLSKAEKLLVHAVETLKTRSGAKTWQIENAFVILCLLSAYAVRTLFENGGVVELLGVAAVSFTFSYTSLANRLEEKEAQDANIGKRAIPGYRWLTRYLYLKELCWFFYFILTGAYSALCGVVLFLLYGWWRAAWRRHHQK